MPGVEVFTAPWPFLFWRIRSSERFDKSPSPDEVANCAVHRADFTNNRRNTRGIKVYSSPIMIPRPSVFPVIVLASYDTESPRSTSYSVLPPLYRKRPKSPEYHHPEAGQAPRWNVSRFHSAYLFENPDLAKRCPDNRALVNPQVQSVPDRLECTLKNLNNTGAYLRLDMTCNPV